MPSLINCNYGGNDRTYYSSITFCRRTSGGRDGRTDGAIGDCRISGRWCSGKRLREVLVEAEADGKRYGRSGRNGRAGRMTREAKNHGPTCGRRDKICLYGHIFAANLDQICVQTDTPRVLSVSASSPRVDRPTISHRSHLFHVCGRAPHVSH